MAAILRAVSVKCSSYKRLRREAYFASPEGTLYTMWGRRVKHWQSIFFCIDVKSISFERLSKKYFSIVQDKKLDICNKIDTIVSLSSTKKYAYQCFGRSEGRCYCSQII